MRSRLYYSFLLLFLVLSADVQAQCGIFYDDFETGSLQAWWLGGAGYTQTITSTNPAAGTYSFEHTGNSGFYSGTYTTFTASQPDYISVWMKTNNTSAANGYFVAGDAGITGDNGIIFCYFNSSGSLRFYNTSGYNHPISANTWYHVEFRNINYTNRNMDVYVNGALILTGWAFRSPTATTFDRVHLFNLSSATATYDNIQIGALPVSIDSVNITDITCPGDTGAIDISVSSTNGIAGYNWTSGDLTEDISFTSAGTYGVLVTDSAGCTAVDSFTVSAPASWADSVYVTDETCPYDSSGMIDYTLTGGTPGYSYSWSNGQNLEDPSGLTAGVYYLTATDTMGCMFYDTVAVSGPAAWSTTVMASDLLCNGDMSGAIDLTPGGANGGYTYAWSTGDSIQDLTGLMAGGYVVTVTDSMGCTWSDSVYVNEPAALTASSTSTPDMGGNDGTIDLTVGGGTPGYTYAWSNGATTEDLTGLASGTYTVTVTDANGCTTVDSVVVTFVIAVNGAVDASAFEVYPNPFNDRFVLVYDHAENLEGSLLDLNGRVLWTRRFDGLSGKAEITPDLPAGIYLLRLETDRGVQVRKLVKE